MNAGHASNLDIFMLHINQFEVNRGNLVSRAERMLLSILTPSITTTDIEFKRRSDIEFKRRSDSVQATLGLDLKRQNLWNSF